MDNNYGLHIRTFNERVNTMNQTRGTQLVLPADSARALQSDIYALLAHVATLSQALETKPEATVQVSMDGGGFK